MRESEKYKLSVYEAIETLRETEDARVELVRSTLDGELYIKKTYMDDKRAVYRQLAEIENPGVPRVYEIFFGADTIIIEQYIEGSTLYSLIEEGRSFSRAELEKLVFGLMDAIAALHRANIIHRDIKPGNIVIRPDGSPVLIDYGIARAYSKNCQGDTEHFGTIGYAAPEQFGFSQSDFRTDIYALGITVNELLCEKNSWKTLDIAVAKCKEFDPEHRFQSIGELQKFLLDGEKKRRAAFFALGIGAAVILAAIVLAFLFGKGGGADGGGESGHTDVSPDIADTTFVTDTEADDTGRATESEAFDDSTEQTSFEEEPTGEEPDEEEMSQFVYEPFDNRILDTGDSYYLWPCLLLHEDGEYKVRAELEEGRPEALIEATKDGKTISIRIDGGEEFVFTDDSGLSTASYPGGGDYGELFFYDMNNDGVFDIIPLMSNGRMVKDLTGYESLLSNYALGWCIYSENGAFKRAEGEMCSIEYGGFFIYDTMPGYIVGDFPAYYKLTDGKIEIAY